MIIVLDPGHGGDNTGLTYNGLTEKYMTRATAQAMKEELEKYNGVTVYITNPDPEKDLSLKERAEYAKSVEADVLISLHYNMSEDHRMFGAEAWIPSRGQAYADMHSLGDVFMEEFRDKGLTIRGVKTRLGSGGADYYGIIRESANLGLPCILVEHCHADHAQDIDHCDTEDDWAQFGKLDAKAVAEYYHLKSDVLNVDYSDYIKNAYFAPEQAVTPDTTGPTAVSLEWVEEKSVSENGICRDVQTFHLQGNEEQTSIVYYDYSLDGGATWSEAYPFAEGQTRMDIEIPNVRPGNHVVARLFNGSFISGRSNTITFQEAPKVDEVGPDRDTVSLETTLGLTKESYGRMGSFMWAGWIWAAIALFMSAICLGAFFKSGQRKRRPIRVDQDGHVKMELPRSSARKQGLFLALTVFLILAAFMPVSLLSLSRKQTSDQIALLEAQHKEAVAFNEENAALRYEQERILKELIMTDAGTVEGEYVEPVEKETVVVYDIAKGYMRVPLVEGVARNTLNMEGFSGTDLTKTYAGGATLGIDVSKFQGEIDWQKVASAGVKFVVIRLGSRAYGSGELVIDGKFYDNIEGAQEAGLQTGVYFFSTAISEKEAVEEADFVTDTLEGYTLPLPVVFDTELITYAEARNKDLTPNQLTAITKAFCERIKASGRTPMIYSNAKRFTTVLHLEELEEYQKWYADYREKPDYPYAFTMWQFTEHGSVPGISGDVDIDLMFQ